MKATSMGVFMTKSRSIAFQAQTSQMQMMADKLEKSNEKRNPIGSLGKQQEAEEVSKPDVIDPMIQKNFIMYTS